MRAEAQALNHRRDGLKRIAVGTLLISWSCATGATPGQPTRAGVVPSSAALAQPATQAARPAPPLPPPPGATLYARLGGAGAITAVVDDFLDRVSKDERINGRFLNADLPRLRNLLVDFVCQAAGGPCKYTGKDMKAAHVDHRIVGWEFDALVQDLQGALARFKVPAREQGELLGALGPLKGDVTAADQRAGSGDAAQPPLVGEGITAAAPEGAATAATAATAAVPADPVIERARAVRQAANLLEKANAARRRGDRSYAEQLFSAAELLVGAEALAELAPLFRYGAPPRVVTSTKAVRLDAPSQPQVLGNSDDDEGPPASASNRQSGSLVGTVVAANGRPGPAFAVVTLEPATGKIPRRVPKERVIEQRGRQFAPRVLAVPVGSKVSFPNFDPIYHNVFSRSAVRPFDLGIYKAGQARELLFDKEGVVRIACNLHANMSAYVAVVAAPHYVVADSAGKFTFRSLVPGRYRLSAWTETSQLPNLQTVEIQATENRVVVTLAPDSPIGPQVDKFGASRGGTIQKK